LQASLSDDEEEECYFEEDDDKNKSLATQELSELLHNEANSEEKKLDDADEVYSSFADMAEKLLFENSILDETMNMEENKWEDGMEINEQPKSNLRICTWSLFVIAKVTTIEHKQFGMLGSKFMHIISTSLQEAITSTS